MKIIALPQTLLTTELPFTKSFSLHTQFLALTQFQPSDNSSQEDIHPTGGVSISSAGLAVEFILIVLLCTAHQKCHLPALCKQEYQSSRIYSQ